MRGRNAAARRLKAEDTRLGYISLVRRSDRRTNWSRGRIDPSAHYDRKPRAEILRLRSLALRRRAILTAPTGHDGQYIRSLSFVVRCPPAIAWHVLGYWRCQYPVDTLFIDELGVH